MKRLLAIILAVMVSLGTFAQTDYTKRQNIVSYASSLKGKKKAELKAAIYNLCQPTKVLSYGSGSGATWSGFVKTDRVGTTLECRNRYSEKKFYFLSATSTTSIDGMNIEHSFPKSWWGGDKNNAYKDLFNLYPSDGDANSAKSNYPMGKVTNPTLLDDYEKVGTGDAGGTTIRLCEPNDTWKGDFCRSYFYMATIYQNLTWTGAGSSTTGGGLQSLENNTWPTLKEWAYTLYLEWTRNDRFHDYEVDRNNAVYAIQGNRNLFVDFPELAEYVWGDSIDVAFNPNTSLTSASDDPRFTVYQAGNYEQGQSGGGETTQVAIAPTLTASASFTSESYEVTITNRETGATVYYTTDGSEPTTTSTSFTGESKTLTITATTTVKAMAVVSGKDNSTVTSATYTKTETTSIANTQETAYTVNEANALITAGNDLDQEVYVKGIISKVKSFDSTYGSISYYISEDGTTNNQFYIYSGLNLNKAEFTSTSDIEVGAKVIIYGKLTNYNGTYEMKYNNYLVKYVAPGTEEVTLSGIAIGGSATKTTYNVGDAFDYSGLTVTATYSDNSTSDVTADATWSSDNSLTTAGTFDATVTATYEGKTATKTYSVTVEKEEVEPDEEVVITDEATTVFDFTDPASIGIDAPETSGSTFIGDISYLKDNITFSATTASGKTGTRIYNSKGTCTLRVYEGGTITFTAPTGYVITGVTFSYNNTNTFASASPETLSEDGKTWTGSSNAVTFTASNSIYVNTATITYGKVSVVRKGDINLDGEVDIEDVTALTRIIMGTWEGKYGKADVNGDGKVNVADLAKLIDMVKK